MPRRLRTALDNASAAGAGVAETAELAGAFIEELADNGIEITPKLGGVPLPFSFEVKLAQGEDE